ncbi:TDP-N-acetylfucosamine:lipid II N-acetylfucosaminyltransferase [uncultured Clostridium sp.]|uniref:TDP-N-acetylfucosamine:lipid II N-acetylfucosaminyltransferase n=1 Tax=uncultured Clostridium sp. TaxID=59620 RepID=UPI00258EA203|nr:TDP-N-acetylfucosamine:lipid II N-acetylfucosaminyltransferase [uncultured Clostridium sp.]
MILHLFPQEKFTVPFIKFINTNFDIKDHLFIIYGENNNFKKEQVENFENIIYFNKNNMIELIKYTNKSKKIILHSFFIPKIIKIYFFIRKDILKKSAWVIWGADLYSYKRKSKSLKSKISRYINKRIIKNMDMIISLTKSDYILAKKWFKAKGKHREGMYINPLTFEYLEEIKLNKIKENNSINIQIGNSADESNLHFEVIDLIEKYKDEDIKIFVPLSYGNKEYAIKVKEYGENIFKDKFIAILDFMDQKEYSDFLSNIDICVFNNNRQQALGNIRTLLYLGSKVYMRDDTTMWKDFISDGYMINNIKDIKRESFKDFISVNEYSIIKNSNLAEYTFNEKKIAEKWLDIFK